MKPPRQFTAVLADDVAALRKLIRIAVEGSGRFRVVAEASTGSEAIQAAATHSPDLVLLDLSMPEMDGLEALPRVLEASPRSRVVVLSGFNHVRMGPVARRLGASAYLEKGVEPEDLVKSLLDVLEPQDSANAPTMSPPNPRRPAAASVRAAAPTIRILLLIKDPSRTEALRSALGPSGSARFEVVHASNWPAGMESLRDTPADVILIDPRLGDAAPDDTLIEVLAQASQTPVVALLPAAETALAARAIKLGVEDCLPLEAAEPEAVSRSLLYAIERRRAQEARRTVQARETEVARLRELEQLKSEFFNAAAHELGTPLTPIRLQLHLLKTMDTGGQSAVQRKAIEIVDRNVERLSKLTQEILDVARLQAGHLRISRHPTELDTIIREVADSFEPVALAQGIEFAVTGDCRTVLSVDAKRITQVLFNLVNNALKFTSRGGRVAIEVTGDDQNCIVLVHDTGIGMRPDQIARLFQPFVQVHDGSVAPGLGTGLGLFVSRGIIELHGGRIWCESPGPGKGSTFSFSLPRIEAPSAPVSPSPVAAAGPPA